MSKMCNFKVGYFSTPPVFDVFNSICAKAIYSFEFDFEGPTVNRRPAWKSLLIKLARCLPSSLSGKK